MWALSFNSFIGRLGSKIAAGRGRGMGLSSHIMGDYKGRVRLRQRKRRFAKDQRIKALATAKKETAPPQEAVAQQ
jgi:hypothetical protein